MSVLSYRTCAMWLGVCGCILCLFSGAVGETPTALAASSPASRPIIPAAAVSPTKAVVSSTADIVDGTTTSITALNRNPGSDNKISLREALLASNADSSTADLTITFDIPTSDAGYANGMWIVRVAPQRGALPALTRGHVTIDGTTSNGTTGVIVIDGGYNADNTGDDLGDGLTLASARNIVRGIVVQRFSYQGVSIAGANARDNMVRDSVVRANGGDGVLISGASATGNVLAGVAVLDNLGTGVNIADGASTNSVGGTTATNRNRISGNKYAGVVVSGTQTRANVVAGNWIGLSATGLVAAPNIGGGIRVIGATGTHIGGSTADAGNIISGTVGGSGVSIEGAVATVIAGNVVGLAMDAKTPLSNQYNGIDLRDGATQTVIGGTSEAERNIIAGNGKTNGDPQFAYGNAIQITGNTTTNNRVVGNYIGLNVSQNVAIGAGNYRYGVLINFGANNNSIGGSEPGAANVISYNGFGAIRIDSSNNQVQGNYVGVGADGVTELGNQNNGIRIGGSNNVVGPGNIIAYSALSAVVVSGSEASNTQIISNTLMHNARSGICVAGPNTIVTGNTIHDNGSVGPFSADCNVRGGIAIMDANGAVISSNSIFNNVGAGITVHGGTSNRLWMNSISDNSTVGISLENGGNEGIAPPIIDRITMQNDQVLVAGRSCSGCLVEIYSDDGNEGRYFVASTNAIADGTFLFRFKANSLVAPNITATLTDMRANTSSFARAVPVTPSPAPTYVLLLPVVTR